MKYKKITILMILTMLLLICSLSTISAANQTITDTSTGGIAQGITNTGDKETLFLQPGTYNKTGQDTSITISKNITIQGNGSTDSVIIDAQKLSRIFTIGNGYNVTFINITFTNANFTGNGGAIYNNYANTTMTFINCSFNNTLTIGSGGAIYNVAGNMKIENCIFSNNKATNGAGIYNSGVNMSVTNSTFTNNQVANTTTSNGYGTIYSTTYGVKIDSCNFTNNNARSGAAIYNTATGNITVSNSTFTENSVYGSGAINNFGNMTVIDCNFTSNQATDTDCGAIFTTGSSNLTVLSSNFINNKAAGGAGAIRGNGGFITIMDSTFINNTAISQGGAISSLTNMSITRCVFDNNTGLYGGAIAATGPNVNITSCIFTNNSANTYGGAIRRTGANMTIMNSTFTNNSAVIYGGAIFNSNLQFVYTDSINTTIVGSTFTNNKADIGGAIYNFAVMEVTGNTMTGNTATTLGHMIYNNGTMGVLNLTFIDNSTWVVKNGSTITLYATLTDDMGNTVTWQNISFYLNGVFFENVTAIEGYANITYTPSNAGDIPVSGEYAGIGTYNIIINNGLLKVKIPTKITISVPKEVKVGDTAALESKLTDENGNPITGATVDFYVDGVKVGSGVTDENGIAKLNYTFTKAGKPNVEVKYAGNDIYFASNATNSTTVSKIPTKITVETNEDTITATLTDEDGNPLANKKVTITVNGKTYTKTTNSQGQVIIKYKNAWDYKVTANFPGDNQYLGSKATAPKRTPTKVTIKVKGDKITATLTDKNGKPIAGKKLTFRVKGVVIGVGITDANGQVVIYYKNANKKAVTVSFEGDNEYAPSSATSIPESDNVQISGKVAMKNTGIPIVAMLLALIASIGLVTLRKRE